MLYSRCDIRTFNKEKVVRMTLQDLLKCPHCGFEEDLCFFPDLFYPDDYSPQYNEQAELLEKIQELGYNIVTCGKCGEVFIERLKK